MMAYCPECGSEVAPTNTFCAYCGIALQPVSTVEETPSQPEIAVTPEPQNIVIPNTPLVNEPNLDVQPNQGFQIEPIQPTPIPPTPFILEEGNFPPMDSSNQYSASVAPEYNKTPIENESVASDSEKTEDFSREIIENEFQNSPINSSELTLDEPISNVSQFQQPIISNEPVNDLSTSLEIQPENQFLPKSEEKPFAIEAIEYSVQKESPAVSEILSPTAESKYQESEINFAETMPYTPADYVSNSLQRDENQDTKNESVENDDKKSTEVFSSEEFIKSLSSENQAEVAESNFSQPSESINTPAFSVENKLPTPIDSQNPLVLDEDRGIEIPNTPIPEPPPVTPVFISLLPKEENVGEVAEQIKEPIKSEVVSTENRPVTQHNIGVIDTDGNKSAKLKPIEEGTILNGRYEIVRKIGGGGMGAVYLASDRNLGGVLRAVKEMVQSSIEDEQQEKAINDFKRESTILSALEHPAIPTIFDYFFDEKEGRFYLVMRYISGGDLASRLRSAPEGKIDEATVTDWGIQLADVLNYLHRQEPPIVYRDLKPSNIMIDGNTGRIMLIDFGIARLINSDQTDVTAVGTMGYAPPELYRKNVEPRSDIFSLGSTMFHLLTGADPQSNPLLIFDFNKNPRPRQINSLLSDQMEQILVRAVELDASNRFSSAAEMRDVLKTHLDNLLKGSVTHGVVSATNKVTPASTLPVFCGFCGQKIVATDQFCPFCGSQQPTAGQSSRLQQVPIYSAPRQSARVLVISTNDLNAPEFNLDKETNLVGRRDPMSNIFPEVDLSKFDPQTKISRKHARIWVENDKYMLEDLGSSNGTVLMSVGSDSVRLLPRQPHILSNGDKIKVGDTTLHFFVG